jgi:hypothetical protein
MFHADSKLKMPAVEWSDSTAGPTIPWERSRNMIRRNRILSNLFLATAVAVAPLLTQPQPVKAAGACVIFRNIKGSVFAKKVANPGEDGAIYMYVDGVQVTWFSESNRWFYVTRRRGVSVVGYDSGLEKEC